MNALTQAKMAGSNSEDETRALSVSEVDDVAGGGMLFAVGTVLGICFIYVRHGEEITRALDELAEWVRS